MSRTITNTTYRVQTDVVSTEAGLDIEQGTLITSSGKLKYHTATESKEVLIDRPAYVNYFDFDSASVTTITTADTWVKLNSDTISLFSRNGLVHTNNRVTNTGEKKVFKVEGIISIAAGSNQELHAAFFRNGVLHPCSEQTAVTGAGNKTQSIPFHCLIELDTNDFVEVYVKNKAQTTDITLDNVNVIIFEI